MSYTLAGGRVDSSQAIICNLCHKDITNLSLQKRQEHYEHHFQSDSPRSKEKGSRSMWPFMEKDVFWHPSQSISPPTNYSPGLIPVLRRALIKSHARSKTRTAALCYDKTVHIRKQPWDASWGCGYRNYLMACTALMEQPFEPTYLSLLDDGASPPSIRNLQRDLEAAWKEGYDKIGAKDLGHSLVGTSKWIGTAELYTAFTRRRIPCELVDFDLNKHSKDAKPVVDWIVKYFSPSLSQEKVSINDALCGASPVTSTDKIPIILQHKGHSRTIVGYEVSGKGKVNLLAFDPGSNPKSLRKAGLAQSTTSVPAPVSSSKPLSSSILQYIHHPNKRQASDSPGSNKRQRSGDNENKGNNEDEVVIIDDSTPTSPSSKVNGREEDEELDPVKVVSWFRLDAATLGREKQYQILYFPLEEPLSEQAQTARKVVSATRIC